MQCVCWRNDRNSPTDLTNCCRDPFKTLCRDSRHPIMPHALLPNWAECVRRKGTQNTMDSSTPPPSRATGFTR